MSQYPQSPPNLTSLQARIRNAAQNQGVLSARLQHHIAVLVVAQFAAMASGENAEPLLLVKGGSAIELRKGIPHSRTSKDFDAVVLGDIDALHDKLARAGEQGWCGFTATFKPPEKINVPGLAVPPQRITAKLNYQGKPFTSVPIEVSTVEAGDAEYSDQLTSEALASVGIHDLISVPCMTIPWQIAQKLHAVTAVHELPRTNDRAHDLVDLQILEEMLPDSELFRTRSACVAVFEERARQSWPPRLGALAHWPKLYTKAMEGLENEGLAATVEDAADVVNAFIRRIDAST